MYGKLKVIITDSNYSATRIRKVYPFKNVGVLTFLFNNAQREIADTLETGNKHYYQIIFDNSWISEIVYLA